MPRPRPEFDRPDAERRQLTVMFCDLADSTALAGQLDLEDLQEVVRAYQEMCAEVIRGFDGHIAQYLGDGVLIYFGHPQAHEDDAKRAVLAGLEILAALETLNVRLTHEKGVRLAVRIGIHTGPVLVGEVGGGGRLETLAIGGTPNIAARVQSMTEPNTVVISAASARLIQGFFTCLDLGSHTLKGVAVPMQLFRVLGPSGAHDRLEAVPEDDLTPLVGREAEIMQLLARWSHVKDGEGHVVWLSGEAGIGKSRLLRAMQERLREEQCIHLECRCSPYHQHSAFYPVIELCQRLMQWQEADTPEKKRQHLEAVLAHYSLPLAETVPLFADLMGLPQAAAGYAPLHLTSQQRRQKTLEAIITIVLELASRQPVLLIVEDLHWVDPSTLEMLSHLVDQAPTTRLCLVLTSRPAFQPPWGQRSYLMPLTVSRLMRAQVEQMVRRIAGGKSLPVEVLQRVVDRADGVPLFVEEMTKAILETGMLREAAEQYELTAPLAALEIPVTLHDSLMGRLDRLGPAKSIAQLGASIGRQFTYTLLREVTQQDDESLQHELGRLVKAELLHQRGLLPQTTYVFKHALIQEAAYHSLTRRMRQRYHQRIAEVLAEQFAEVTTSQPELLAHHYTEASQYEHAIAWWQRAGQYAVERSANSEAIGHLQKGLELLKHLPDTSERVQHELTLQLALGAPLMMVKGYSAPEVERVYIRARELCHQIGESPQLFSMLSGLRRFHIDRAEFEISHELGEQHLRLAQRLQDPTEILQGHMALGVTSFHLGKFTASLEHLERSIALHSPEKRRSQAFDPMVLCLAYASRNLWYLGYPDKALGRSRETLTLAETTSRPYTLGSALHMVAMLHKERREPHVVQEQAEAAIALGREHGFIRWVGSGMIRRGWALAEQGEAAVGVEQLLQGLTIWEDMNTELGLPHHLAMLAEAYHRNGRTDEGLRILTRALNTLRKNAERLYEAELYRLRGEFMLQAGGRKRVQEAQESLLQALDLARQQQARSLELRAAMSLGRLWQQQGKQTRARRTLAAVYEWFTEGHDTPDLQEAKALLDELR